jgi:bisphosphoglycerate-dependent phosphoglycerate mutase
METQFGLSLKSLAIFPKNVNKLLNVEIVELNIPTAIPLVYSFD